jgi:hypothetical protein
VHYFNTLKVDIGDGELNDFLEFLLEILSEDEELMAYYVAKYSGIFMQFHRRLKKADSEERALVLIQLYTFAYPILKYCGVPCSWMLTSVCVITFAFHTSRPIRDKLYSGMKRSKRIGFQEWMRNLCSSEGIMEEEVFSAGGGAKEQQEEPRDQMVEIYNMFNRGEIDEETLFKMISEASKLEYERQQENQLVEEKDQEVQPELEQEMEAEENPSNHNLALIVDLIDECTEAFTDNLETAYSRIMVLYVMSRAIDSSYEEAAPHLLKRIRKMVT